jgi:hypothetical protein
MFTMMFQMNDLVKYTFENIEKKYCCHGPVAGLASPDFLKELIIRLA